MKKNVFLAVTLLAFIAVGAFAQSESDFKVTKTAEGVTITGYTGSATVVNIPATIQKLPVTIIGKDAFKSNAKITSVTIPDSVLTIEDQAFLGCDALTSVTISERATKMGQDVFAYCPNLTSVTFRGNYLAFEARIGTMAFNRLGDLREKYIKGNWGLYTRPNNTSTTWTRQAEVLAASQNESDFQVKKVGNAITITKYVGKGTLVNIPARIQNLPVTTIGEDAFASNNSITSVAIPNGVITIEIFAFYECTKLTSVTIPNSVKSIDQSAFNKCTSLASVTIPEGVNKIGPSAFQDTKLTSITIPKSITDMQGDVFKGCPITSVTFQGQIKIGVSTFDGFADLAKASKGVMSAGTYTRPNSTSTTWTKK